MKKSLVSLLVLIVLTSTGNAFGANRLVHENFDDKSIDGGIVVWKSPGVKAVQPEYTFSTGRGGAGYCVSSGTINQVHTVWYNNIPKPWPSNVMYVSFWMKYPEFTSTSPNENFKFFYPHWNGTTSYVHYSMTGTNQVYYSAKKNGTMVSQSNWLNYPGMADGNWHHYEFYIDFKTGTSRAWYDGVLKVDHNYGSGWDTGDLYYVAAPSIDAESTGVFKRQVDDWEVWDGMPTAISEPVPAPSDTEKPYIYSVFPGLNAVDVDPGTGISLHVADKGDGVDKSTIAVSVNGQSVAPNISGTASDYMVSYTPTYNFNYGEKVNVSVGARDLAGNSISYIYSFTVADAPLPSGATTAVFGEVPGANYPKTATDTFININTENTLTNTSLNTYTWPDNSPANAILMKWDISGLPANAKIYDAKLYLYMNQLYGTGGDSLYDLSVHKIINKNPDLTKATGYTYDGTNPWTTNSLSYNGIPLAQKDIAPAADLKSVDKTFGYKSWNVTQIVKDWQAAPQNNYGLLLNSDLTASSNSNRFFASSEAADASQRPKLVIIYTIDPTLAQPPAPPTGLRIIQ